MSRLARILLTAAALVVAGPALLAGWLRWNHARTTSLPQPPGPFAVGRVSYAWRDEARADPFAPDPAARRELVVWIWYPAAKAGQPAPYVPEPVLRVREQRSGALLRDFVDRDRRRVECHSLEGAPVSPAAPRYPVVFFKSGLGAYATDYTVLAEDLASRGYVVAANDSPYTTGLVVFPDGRVVARSSAGHPAPDRAKNGAQFDRLAELWSADTRFILDQLARLDSGEIPGAFKGRLDLGAVGIFGHSFGGAAAAQFCHDDPRCKAAIDIDGMPFGSVVRKGVQRPFMFLLSDHSSEHDPESEQVRDDIAALYHRSTATRFCLQIDGARHFNFSDQALIKPHLLMALAGGTGWADPRRVYAVAGAYVAAFFDSFLKRAPSKLLEGPSPPFPEVRFIEPGARVSKRVLHD